MKNNLLTIYLLKKDIVFSIPIEKEVPKTDKSREEIAKTYPTDYNLLITQYLWQAHYEILLVILLTEFLKLKTSTDMMKRT